MRKSPLFVLSLLGTLFLFASLANAVPVITFSPDVIDFGQVALNAGSGSVNFNEGILVSTSNSGNGLYSLQPLTSLSAPFSFVSLGTCSTGLSGGVSCSLIAPKMNTTVAGVYDELVDFDFTPTGGVPELAGMLEFKGQVGAVPERSTWAMMILGFAAIGFMAYRKKSALRFA